MPDRPALVARHSESTVLLPDHKDPRCIPVYRAHLTGKLRLPTPFQKKKSDTASATSYRTRLCLCHSLSSGKCSVGVHLPKGWHQLPSRRYWASSASHFRQGLTGVGIGHTRLNDNLLCSPSPSCSLALFYFQNATQCLLSGPWLSCCCDYYRITRRIAIIQNAELRHIPEWHLNLKYDANYHRVLVPRLLVRQQRKRINM